jgi:hypothetical protein
MLEHPARRTEVDDRAAARRSHVGGHRLGGEELVLEVDRDAGVPARGCGVLDLVALVVGRVVQQRGDRPEARAHGGDRLLERRRVGDVGAQEQRRGGRTRREPLHQRLARRDVEVDEADASALRDELFYERRADAAGSAGDEHRAASQTGITG